MSVLRKRFLKPQVVVLVTYSLTIKIALYSFFTGNLFDSWRGCYTIRYIATLVSITIFPKVNDNFKTLCFFLTLIHDVGILYLRFNVYRNENVRTRPLTVYMYYHLCVYYYYTAKIIYGCFHWPQPSARDL